MAILSAALGLWFAANFSTPSCNYGRSTYQHVEEPSWRITFTPLDRRASLSDMALHLVGPGANASYWFVYDGGSAPAVALISTTDVTARGWTPPQPEGGVRPLGSLWVYAMDASMRISFEIPKLRAVPPMYLFVPELSEALRGSSPRHNLRPGIFKLTGCR